MILEPLKPRVLSMRTITAVHPQLAARFGLAPEHRAVGLVTCTIDDCLYAALDEGTKAARVDVVYAKSFYAGSAHASGPFSGEILGVFASHDEEEVSTALQATVRYLETKAWFYAADEASRLGFFPHVIPSVGRYLGKQAGVEPGTPMAYLIAPPIEATLGLDAALKVADVTLRVWYPPPSETNFSGGLLTGDQPAVEAAARAFQETVLDLAARPVAIVPLPEVEALAATFGKVARRREGQEPAAADRRFRTWESGMDLAEKPPGWTHLFDDRSLVPKTHPVVRLRGRLDLLQAHVVDAAVVARREGFGDVGDDLGQVLAFLRGIVAAEVVGRPVPTLEIGGLSGEDLHRVSHDTADFLGVGWVLPSPDHGETAARLNLLRATCRDVEIAATDAFAAGTHVPPESAAAILHGLNRLSNALYVLVCRVVARRSRG